MISGQGHCPCEFAGSPHVCVGFLGRFWFPPSPKDVHVRWIGLSTLCHLSAWVCVSVPAVEGCPVEGGFLSCCLNSQDRLWPPMTLDLNKPYLFLLISLRCMYNSHLFQYFILEVLGHYYI